MAASSHHHLPRLQWRSEVVEAPATYSPDVITTTPASEALLLQRVVPMTSDPICRCGHTLSFHLEHWPACPGFHDVREGLDTSPVMPTEAEILEAAKAIRLARKDDRKGAMHDKRKGPVEFSIRVCHYSGPGSPEWRR